MIMKKYRGKQESIYFMRVGVDDGGGRWKQRMEIKIQISNLERNNGRKDLKRREWQINADE